MIGSCESRNVWLEDTDGLGRSFVGFVRFFDKSATVLKHSALVAYPVHEVLLDVSVRILHWI